MSNVHTGGIGRNTVVMAIGTLLSRITGFGRIFALGYALDFSRLTDTYNIANNVPNIVYEAIVGGVLAATLVPVFVGEMSRSKDRYETWRAISAVTTITAVALAIASLVVFLAAPLFIDLYTLGNNSPDTADQRHVATALLRLFVPQILFYGFISIATGALNAHRKFAAPMFAPILNNVIVIAVLLSLPHVTRDFSLHAIAGDTKGMLFLGLGTTLGVIGMAAMLIPSVRSISGGRLRWNWDLRHSAVRSIVRLSGWTLGLVITNQVALWVMTALANRDATAFTAFLAAYTFFTLPHGIFAVSVMSAVQPILAEQWLQEDKRPFGRQTVHGLRLILFVIVPAGVGYMLLANPIVSVALDHGNFTASSAHTTSVLLVWMAMGLPGFSAFLYLTRVFQATKNARIVFYLYLFENGINVVTALPLWNIMGVNGLALSQTLAYTLAAVAAGIILQRRSAGLPNRVLAQGVALVALASAVMGVAVWLTARELHEFVLVQLVAAILVGTVVYLGIGQLTHLSEMDAMTRRLKTMARRIGS